MVGYLRLFPEQYASEHSSPLASVRAFPPRLATMFGFGGGTKALENQLFQVRTPATPLLAKASAAI